MELISWNVNGLRASLGKNLLSFLEDRKPSVVCFQEIKALPDQVDDGLFEDLGYEVLWNSAERKGYSGVLTLVRDLSVLNVKKGMGVDVFDREGRVLVTEFEDFCLVNVYFPHGRRDKSRVPFKMSFCREFFDFVNDLEGPLVLGGDFNVAHTKLDIARPEQNMDNSGFLPVERNWMSELLGEGFLDSFRLFNEGGGHYTWWSLLRGVRERNIGWRIDYFLVSEGLRDEVEDAFILPEVMGSDHCPIGLVLDF